MRYCLFDQILSDTNANLGDDVCSDPTDTSHVQESYHDETACVDCNIFNHKEEDTDEETKTPVPEKLGETSLEKKSCRLSNSGPITTIYLHNLLPYVYGGVQQHHFQEIIFVSYTD